MTMPLRALQRALSILVVGATLALVSACGVENGANQDEGTGNTVTGSSNKVTGNNNTVNGLNNTVTGDGNTF